MGNGVPFLDIILLAMLAGFVIFKLRSVLGKRTGNERRRPDPFAEPAKSNDNGKVVRLPDRSAEAAAEPGAEPAPAPSMPAGVLRNQPAAAPFDPHEFLPGATTALGQTVQASPTG